MAQPLLRAASLSTAVAASVLLTLAPSGTALALEPLALTAGGSGESLGGRLELLEDPTRGLSISDVAAPPHAGRFVPSERDSLNVGMSDSAWWVRFALRNDSTLPQERRLVVGYALTDSLDLFEPDEAGGFRTTSAGDLLPFRDRADDYRKPAFRISVAPGATEVFHLRAQGEDALILPLQLRTEKGLQETRLSENALYGFYYGILATILLYNTVTFIVLRDRSYLYVTLSILGMALWQLSLEGFLAQSLFPESPWWAHRSAGFAGMGAAVFLGAFVRNFLDTRTHLPRVDRGLLACMVVAAGLLVSCIWGLGLVNRFSAFLAAVFVPLAFGSAIVVWRRGHVPGRDFLIAYSPFLLGLAVWGLDSTYGFSESSVLSTYVLQTSFVATAALLSLALTSRERDLTIERDRATTLVQASRRLALYFPSKLVERILETDEEVSLASERRNMTIFFSDLTGFTALTDTNEPERISRLLNQYLTAMLHLVEKHGGTLDKVMGDGIIVFFGAPDEMPEDEQAQRAVTMAVAMQKSMDELGQAWLEEGLDHHVQIRIGIHQEYVTVGNFGSSDLMSYTAIGGGVNLASRLEAGCTPGLISVSYPVYARTREAFPYGPLREREFKGFAHPHRVCELDPKDVAV